MNFRTGDQVRINTGNLYGCVGSFVRTDGRFCTVNVAPMGYVLVADEPFALLDSLANNGD